MSLKLIFLQLFLSVFLTESAITVENGVFKDIFVEINEEIVPFVECTDFLEKFENFFKSSSEKIHWSFFERISFGTFTVLLPPGWDNCIGNRSAENYDGSSFDITVAATEQKVHAQQIAECGQPGEQIFLNFETITNDGNSPELFNSEWLKYRYGIFDDTCMSQSTSLCSEAQQIEETSRDDTRLFTGFSRYLPSLHNEICDRVNPIDIINSHSDMHDAKRHNFQPPKFNYVRRSTSRLLVIIDDTTSTLNERDSSAFLRDALRKFVDKDLNQNTTEVGIHVLSENSTKINQNMIRSMRSMEARDFVLNNFWGNTRYINIPPCSLIQTLERSIDLLTERAMLMGKAENVILIISPGMSKCGDDKILTTLDQANRKNIKIVTLNYPLIGTGRIPMDELALKTGGKAFTVLEQKRNERESMLTTFFELTNILLEISKSYSMVKKGQPVEIYRKELLDFVSRDEDRQTIDSFNVDESLKTFNFFVYFYDRREKNFEKGMKLLSPMNVEYTNLQDRAEYHQLEITGNFSSSGSWTYFIKRLFGYPQPNFVQVLAYPKDQNFVSVKSSIRRSSIEGIFEIIVEIKKGNKAVIDAAVEAVVTEPNGKNTLKLYDITKSNGIYKRFFTPTSTGLYKIEIFANDNGMTSYIEMNSHYRISKQIVPSFQRIQTPMTVFMNSKDIDLGKRYLGKLGKILDLKVLNGSDAGKLSYHIEFTEPDYGYTNELEIKYDIRYSHNLRDMIDNFDTLTNKWNNLESTFRTNNYGMIMSINLPEEFSFDGQIIYVALKPLIEGFVGPISNIVRIQFPSKETFHLHPENSNDWVIPRDPSDSEDTNYLNYANIKLDLIIVSIVCIILSVILLFCLFYCCFTRRNRNKKSKKAQNEFKSSRQSTLSIIKTEPPVTTQSIYTEQINHSCVSDYPEINFVGLPIPMDEEDPRKDMSYFETSHQRYDHYDRNSLQILDGQDPVWASYLLKEHAKKLENNHNRSLYEGSECPEIPELPYYDHTVGDIGYHPNYHHSMQSVASERKIRNITMV